MSVASVSGDQRVLKGVMHVLRGMRGRIGANMLHELLSGHAVLCAVNESHGGDNPAEDAPDERGREEPEPKGLAGDDDAVRGAMHDHGRRSGREGVVEGVYLIILMDECQDL